MWRQELRLLHSARKYFKETVGCAPKTEVGSVQGCNYYIELRRRQNANKGRDCEEYCGAIKSRLRSIRVQKLEFARDPPWM